MAEPVMAFTMDVVSRLTGLSEWQLRRLDADGIFHLSLAQENRRRPYSRIYTFADLVSLRVIAKLRKLGISRQEIRRAANLLKELPGASWEGTQFFVAGGKLYLSHDEMVVAIAPMANR
jgi:DNA-binding transcriptional MerR regulator